MIARAIPLPTDAKRLDWLQARLTPHGGVEFLYVVDGYEVDVTEHDGATVTVSRRASTLRDAIDAVMAAERAA